jgi:hypothetical protein
MQNSPTIAGRGSRIGLRAPSLGRAAWTRVGILAVFLAFYVWTAATSDPIRFTTGADRIEGDIANALIHGRLAVRDTPPGLAELPNPYDATQNAQWQAPIDGPDSVHDLSLYDGKLYAYWGPAPALLVFAPARILGFAFSQSLAVALFGFASLIFGILTLFVLQRRFAPAAPAWKVNAAIILLGCANVMPFILRRPMQYEVAIAAGLCFVLLATWLLLGALLRDDASGRPDVRRLAGGSLALGLAMASRPSHAVTALGLVLLSGWLLRALPKEQRFRTAAALVGPVTVIGLLLAFYNYARFDSFTEFGLRYQLTSVDITERDMFSTSYLLPGLWFYFVAPPRLSLVFPFLQLPPPPGYPGDVPKLYDGLEPTGGLFAMAPLVLILLAAPMRRRLEPELRAVLLSFIAISAGLAIVAAVAFWGATMRYEADYASLMLIGALILWLRSTRRWVAVLGTVAIAWSSMVAVAVSLTGSRDMLRLNHPGLWDALSRDFSPVSRAIASVAYGGPAIAEVRDAVDYGVERLNYGSLGQQGITVTMGMDPMSVYIVMPSAGTAHLTATVARGRGVVPGTRVDLLVELPNGRTGTEPLTADRQSIDLPLKLGAGIQRVRLAPQTEAGPIRRGVLILEDLRAKKE